MAISNEREMVLSIFPLGEQTKAAMEIASKVANGQINSLHMVWGLVSTPEVKATFKKLGIDVEDIRQKSAKYIKDHGPSTPEDDRAFSNDAAEALYASRDEMHRRKHSSISATDVLIGILTSEPSEASTILLIDGEDEEQDKEKIKDLLRDKGQKLANRIRQLA